MPTELYANDAAGVVTGGGTNLTSTSWTVAYTSPTPFPAVTTGAGTQFHVADPANPTELVTVTNVTGSGPYTWTVTRGAESTQAVVHAPNFTVRQVVSAGDLTGLAVKSLAANNTIYVTLQGNDTNDGLSWGTAKLTVAGALTALGSQRGTIQMGYGTWYITANDNYYGSGVGNAVTLANGGTVLRGMGTANTRILIENCTVVWGIQCVGGGCMVCDLQVFFYTNAIATYGVGVDTFGITARTDVAAGGWSGPGQNVTDSAAAASSADIGSYIVGAGINPGTTISTFTAGSPATYGISSSVTGTASGENFTIGTAGGSAEGCSFWNVTVSTDGAVGAILTNGFAISPEASTDVAETYFYHCEAAGGNYTGSACGFLVGNGVQGNILNTFMYGCDANGWTYGITMASAPFHWIGGTIQHNTTDVYAAGSCNGTCTVEDVRVEESGQFLLAGAGGGDSNWNIRNVEWETSGSERPVIPSGALIDFSMQGVLNLDGIKLRPAITTSSQTPYIVTPCIRLGNQVACTVNGLQMPVPYTQAFSTAATSRTTVQLSGYCQLDPTTDYILANTGAQPGALLLPQAVTSTINSSYGGYSVNFMSPLQAQTLASNGAVTIETGAGIAEITLNANATSSAVQTGELFAGQQLVISWIQGAAGNHTYVWPTICQFIGGSTPPNLLAPGQIDTATFVYDGTHLIQTGAGSANVWAGSQYFKSGRPWFDVCAFGADPTGVADSTLAFNTAIAAALGSHLDTNVGTTAGSYSVTDPAATSADLNKYVNGTTYPFTVRTDSGTGVCSITSTTIYTIGDTSAVAADLGMQVTCAGYLVAGTIITAVTANTGYTISQLPVQTGTNLAFTLSSNYSKINAVTTAPAGYTVNWAAAATTAGQTFRIGYAPVLAGQYATGPVYIPAGTYKITSDLLIQSVLGFQLKGAGVTSTNIQASGGNFTTALINVDGSLDGVYGGFEITGSGTEGTGGTGSTGLPNGFNLTWAGSAYASRSTSANVIRDLRVRNLKFYAGVSLAGVGANQLDGTNLTNIVVSGQQAVGQWTTSGFWQYGLVVGNGTYGNIYDQVAFAVSASGCYHGYYINVSGIALWGAQPGGNAIDFYLIADAQTSITNIQSQLSAQFMVCPAQAAWPPITISDVVFAGYTNQSPHTGTYAYQPQWISTGTSYGNYTFQNLRYAPAAPPSPPVISIGGGIGGSYGQLATLINIAQAAPPSTGIISGTGVAVVAINYLDTTPGGPQNGKTPYPYYAINTAFNLASGIAGATSASRWVGAVSGAAPTVASPAAGDFAADQAGAMWVYTGTSWQRLAGTKRVVTVTGSGGTYTPNSATTDIAVISTPTTAFTIAAPSGTPADGQSLIIRFLNGVSTGAVTWAPGAGGYLAGSQVTLPTTFSASLTDICGFQYDAALSAWLLLAYAAGY